MSGTEFFADTNAILYILSGNECMKPYISKKMSVSIITEMELLSFSKLSVEEEEKIKKLIGKCSVIPIEDTIKEKTIELRKKYNIKLPDAIIAASSIESGLPLVTADKGFQKIEELNLELIEPVL